MRFLLWSSARGRGESTPQPAPAPLRRAERGATPTTERTPDAGGRGQARPSPQGGKPNRAERSGALAGGCGATRRPAGGRSSPGDKATSGSGVGPGAAVLCRNTGAGRAREAFSLEHVTIQLDGSTSAGRGG